MKCHGNKGPAILACSLAFFFSTVIPGTMRTQSARADGIVPFAQIAIDATGPKGNLYYGMHIKTVGDVNGDGYPDMIVAGATPGEPLIWYESPAGTKHVISDLGGWSTDAAVGDIDQDGDQDILVSCWYRADKGLEWFENQGNGTAWTRHPIGQPQAHDLELTDLDRDGDLDIVTRLQEGDGDAIEIWRQDGPEAWQHVTITAGVPTGEGLAAADIDRDGDPDIIVNGKWFANPRDIIEGVWAAYTYTTSWTEPDTIVAIGDINRDGCLDIALTPSEAAGQRYRISWFESPGDPLAVTDWVERVIDPDVEAVLHSLQLADIDKDGDLDLITAKMHQGAPPHDVLVYTNVGAGGIGTEWSRQVIATTASHSIQAADFDLDGDIDLFGANWSGDANVYLFRNDMNERLPLDKWTRHIIDDKRPWNAVFIAAGDIDLDGWTDVITGGWWYRNPGSANGVWTRNTIGSPLNNMAAVYDYDHDGAVDVLGTPWAGAGANPNLVWARNDGTGRFTVLNNIPTGQGDFLQGVAVGRFLPSGPVETALSWHDGTGQGAQALTAGADPISQAWSWRKLCTADQAEQLSSGDIDRDGSVDLLLGTQWLRNAGGAYEPYAIANTSNQPDRNRLADINRDGRLDAVVGFLGISAPATLAWYEQPADATGPWIEHVISTVIGPMSLDVGDIDIDGDLDVVIGEHNLAQPQTARVIIFENADGLGETWAAHIAYTGDEHHDGTQLVDIDTDGDLDIVSIGWGHARVLLYRNNAMESGERISGPVPPVPDPPLPPIQDPPTPDTPPTTDPGSPPADDPASPPVDTGTPQTPNETDDGETPAPNDPDDGADVVTDEQFEKEVPPPMAEACGPGAATTILSSLLLMLMRQRSGVRPATSRQ